MRSWADNLGRSFFAVVAAGSLICAAAARADGEDTKKAGEKSRVGAAQPADAETIKRWARELDHVDYATREAAGKKLFDAGAAAVDALTDTVLRGSLEARIRAMAVLTWMLDSDDLATYAKAKNGLKVISRTETKSARDAQALLALDDAAVAGLTKKMEIGIDFLGRVTWGINRIEPSQGPKGLADKDLGRLKVFPDLVYLDLSGEVFANDGYFESQVTDAGLARLAALKKLEYLDLEGAQVTDAGMRHVAAISSLKTLRLNGPRITEKGLAPLGALTRLETLDLNYTGVADLRPLGEMPSLRTLVAADLPLTDRGLEGFSGLANLTELKMTFGRDAGRRFSKHANAGLVHLRFLKKLQRLELRGSHVGDAGLAGLRDLHDLRKLIVWNAELTDAGLKHLQSLAGLERLELWFTNVTGSGLRHLKDLKNLRVLYLAATPLSAGGIQHLPSLPRLEEFAAGYNGPDLSNEQLRGLSGMKNLKTIRFTPMTDAVLAQLEGLEKLESLSCSTKVTDAGAASLGKIPGLRSLELTDTQITDAGLAHLKSLRRLRALSLARTRITDVGVAQLKGLHELISLYLSGTRITDRSVESVANLASLEFLYLHDTSITDSAVPHLERLSRLKILNLERTRLTEAAVKQLRARLPRCTIQFSVKRSKGPSPRSL